MNAAVPLRAIQPQTDERIYVTQPHLAPLEEFIPYLKQIWDSKILTNCGPFHQQLEAALCKYLGVRHLALFSNGTLALVTALQALRITGEVITTPYSFVATAHSLVWNGIKPVFVDVDPAHAESRSGQDRSRDHAANHRDHAGALLREPVRRRGDSEDRRQLQPEGDLRRRACVRRADRMAAACSNTAICRC